MDSSSAPPERPLEERLRNMILSNVTINGSSNSHQGAPNGSQRFRGRSSPRNHGFGNNAEPLPQSVPHGGTTTRGYGQFYAPPSATAQPYRQFEQRPSHYGPHNPAHAHTYSHEPRYQPGQFNRGRGRGGPRHFQHRQSNSQQNTGEYSPDKNTFPGPQRSNWHPHRHPFHGPPRFNSGIDVCGRQSIYLHELAMTEIPRVEMTQAEMIEKDTFRVALELVCQNALQDESSTKTLRLALKPFGSFNSGFAMSGSDMDLAISLFDSESGKPLTTIDREIPRLLEKLLLDKKYGARLLSRTRVPILKICERPSPELFTALCEERQKWDELPEDQKYAPIDSTSVPSKEAKETENLGMPIQSPAHATKPPSHSETSVTDSVRKSPVDQTQGLSNGPTISTSKESEQTSTDVSVKPNSSLDSPKTPISPKKMWIREKKLGPLDFPKDGVGIQCDINFSTKLGLYNTRMLYCYSLCDARVRPIVLFVKYWAKSRKINSAYSGTLSSYGYVLMVLHFLANIASPPVVPNLQHAWRRLQQGSLSAENPETSLVDGCDIRFWDDEKEITRLASQGALSQNQQQIGELLRNFFQYYAHTGSGYTSHGYVIGYQWTQEVLSLRTAGGILTKTEKGWVGATTTVVEGKEVRNRYLFAIEDPFELNHNVARTVTHNGIIAIRDEFRRAWRILQAVGHEKAPEGELLAPVQQPMEDIKGLAVGEEDSRNSQGTDQNSSQPRG